MMPFEWSFRFVRVGRAPKATAREDPSRRLGAVAELADDVLLAELGASAQGLTETESASRLEREGPNVVAAERRKHPLVRFLELLGQPLSLLLIALAIVTDLTGEVDGAIVIAVIVVMSVLLSFIQEYRSNAAAEKLRAMVHTTATVGRRGDPDGDAAAAPLWVEVPLEHVVPGDIVHLSAGDMVPADARVLAAKDLFVNQSALTGESLPVEKFSTAVEARGRSVLELPNLCFMGSNVMSGTATAVVVATGRGTYFGGVAATLTARRPPTSFDLGVKRFIALMLRFMGVMVPVVFLVNGLDKGNWLEALLFALAIAVGLTPELLPMIVTLNLAKGAIAMSRRRVVAKRLAAIQNFGAMDVLCTDKTGTLTQDKVVLERYTDAWGKDNEQVLEYAYLNSRHQTGLKNLLDVAVLERAGELSEHVRNGLWRKIDEVPFDFQRRRMSVVVARDDGRRVLICKGSAEEIFGVCKRVQRGQATEPLVASDADACHAVVRELNEDGFRVIAVAFRDISDSHASFGVADEADLVLLGYVAFLDPPKDSAAAAIGALRERGIAVKVLTGDNDIVTRRICSQVGLKVERVVLGSEIDALGEDELAELAEHATVFARLSPQQKARVIQALRRRGHAVGFLGDGINDGPALKAADVGISVDTAVDVAKESADIILLEKNLRVLGEGVMEGRKVFGNILKYVRMGASSNFGNVFSVLGASAFLPFLPMLPVQILLNNLLYDVSQTAVATDNVDAAYLKQPRKWEIGGIGRFMLVMGPLSSVFDYVTFAVMLSLFDWWQSPELFQSGWFVESLLTQTLVVHVLRTRGMPLVQSRASFPLVVATLAICLAGVWLPYSHFAPGLGLAPLPWHYWLALPFIVGGYLVVTQLVKTRLVDRLGLG
jgi:P-type Mg2+ transporter